MLFQTLQMAALTPSTCITRMPVVSNLAPSSQRRFAMSINPDFLKILRCPFCKSNVELKADGSGLKCETCHRVYPIRDDIPIMIVDEATIEKEVEA